jgi:drug/metabolite transporter (DMT)-like permease
VIGPGQLALHLAGLLVMGVGWGGNIMLAKLATSLGAPPAGLAFLEAAGSGLLLLLASWIRGRSPRLDGRHLRFYVISGALGVAIPNFIIFHAARHLSAGLIAILMTLIPLVTYGVSLIMRIERFWWVRALGLLFGLLGVTLILAPSSSLPDASVAHWVVVGFLATTMFAVQNVYIAHAWPRDGDALSLSCGGLIASAVMLAPLAWLHEGFIGLMPPWGAVQWAGIAMALVNALMSAIFILSIRYAGPVFTSQTAYLITIAGVLWGMLLLHEHHSLWIWAAMLAMCAGVALVTRRPRQRPAGEVLG